jgi:toxin ParE1/3/4
MAAADDLDEISNYLYLNNPSFAATTIQRLYDSTKLLRAHPHSGRLGKKSGTRELVLAPLPYVVMYAVDEHAVHVLRILHGSRDWR